MGKITMKTEEDISDTAAWCAAKAHGSKELFLYIYIYSCARNYHISDMTDCIRG